MIAVKTKGGMRFVTPSLRKSTLNAGVSTRPAITARPADTHTTTASTAAAAAAATATSRNKQSATIPPTSQLTKVTMMMISFVNICLM